MSTYLTEKAIQDLTNDRRQIHPYPELAYEEHQTHAFIVNRLKSYGYEAIQTLGETGIVTILQGSKTEPVLLLRADMDALPITEETDVPFISEHPGKMHACGHDTHVAMLLAVARYFKEHEKELRGTLKFVFQPAEEGGLGARKMVEQGVLEQPQVDACLALHVWSSIPTGKIGLKSGPLMASVDRFDLQIQGKGGHGAMPQETVDPIVAGSQLVNALQTIVSRRNSPMEPTVVTVGSFHGGTAFNIIPDGVELTGTVRTFNPQVQQDIKTQFEQITRHICEAHGATYTLDYESINIPTINDPELTQRIENSLITYLGKENLDSDCQNMGGEDFSEYLQHIPGCMLYIGCGNEKKGCSFPHHHPKFKVDEDALPFGAEVLIHLVQDLLNNP